MFEVFTPYLIGGVIAGLLAFLLLFRFWNLPRKIKSHFRLNSRTKLTVFIVVAGFVVAILVTLLVGIAGVPETIAQVIEGVGVGFSCAVVIGVFNASDDTGKKSPAAQTKAATRQPSADNKSRRSKG